MITLHRIGEKMLEWTDVDPTIDTILTNVSLYWFTGSLPTSLYIYRQLFGPKRLRYQHTSTPIGVSIFPYELLPGIKSLIEKECNVVFYKVHDRGGHFAALEQPELLWEDVQAFVKKVWKVWM
jgi:microsomal epoxide hydrolase